MTCAGLPDSFACASNICFSFSTTSAGTSSRLTYWGAHRGDVHGYLSYKSGKALGLGDEVGLAVDFEKNPDLSAGVYVRADNAF